MRKKKKYIGFRAKDEVKKKNENDKDLYGYGQYEYRYGSEDEYGEEIDKKEINKDDQIDFWFSGKKYKKVICHTGHIPVFKKGNIQFYGGGTLRDGSYKDMNPVPDLVISAINISSNFSKYSYSMRQKWQCLKYLQPPTIIYVPIQDFGVPVYPKKFWQCLSNDIVRNKSRRVLCQCQGGHGRTGILLALCAYFIGESHCKKMKKCEELISFIRDNYCQKAIETEGQKRYIAEMTGLKYRYSII